MILVIVTGAGAEHAVRPVVIKIQAPIKLRAFDDGFTAMLLVELLQVFVQLLMLFDNGFSGGGALLGGLGLHLSSFSLSGFEFDQADQAQDRGGDAGE
ncbi:hypothetical protein ACQE3E_06680 [Methylomonas sp. MED-D]|uniref:hypothetical protein n=1 Tax=Methylomonas sp. MED-D TaxID=3418768 RepID=UPI003D06C9FA